jgi:hypothetical protein
LRTIGFWGFCLLVFSLASRLSHRLFSLLFIVIFIVLSRSVDLWGLLGHVNPITQFLRALVPSFLSLHVVDGLGNFIEVIERSTVVIQ